MKEKIKNKIARPVINFFNYLWDDKTRKAFHDWLKLIISFKGIWCFAPAILGIFFVYWANSNSKTLILKANHEVLAICLMSLVVVIFLIRSLLYRLEIDYVLLVIGVNFLCREIHFPGTDNAVVIVAVVVLVWVIYRKNRILANIENAKLVQIGLTGTLFTYLFAILIQRNVFKPERLPLLPDVHLISISLEEVMENIAHMYYLFVGIASFFSISNRGPKKSNKADIKSNSKRQ